MVGLCFVLWRQCSLINQGCTKLCDASSVVIQNCREIDHEEGGEGRGLVIEGEELREAPPSSEPIEGEEEKEEEEEEEERREFDSFFRANGR